MSPEKKRHKWILLGAGLFNMILGLRLFEKGEDVIIVEARSSLDTNKTWSFHKTDLSTQDLEWISPFISKQWSQYEVRFPSYSRRIDAAYCTIKAEDFVKKFVEKFPVEQIYFGAPVTRVELHAAHTEGFEFVGEHIIDARGEKSAEECGYQKFVGWECHFSEGHGLDSPVLMDVQVQQKEGFRFLYCLPWSSQDILIEDTRYSLRPQIDKNSFSQDLGKYISWRWPQSDYKVSRQEVGCLVIPFARQSRTANEFGVRGGFFHPTTGYSLGWALKLSRLVAQQDLRFSADASSFDEHLPSGFYFLLNRLMFFSANSEERWKIFEKFYQLPDDLVARFYAGQSTLNDKLRVFSGRPPVSIRQALPWFVSNWNSMKDRQSTKIKIAKERNDHGMDRV